MTFTIVAFLLGIIGFVGWLADGPMSRARWTDAAPRLALLAWHCLAAGIVVGVTAVAILLTHDALEHVMGVATGVDEQRLHAVYAGQARLGGTWNLSALLVLVGGALAVTNAAHVVRANNAARDIAAAVPSRVLETERGSLLVVPGSAPFAYCVPRTRRRTRHVVVSEPAIDLLSPPLLDAVVAHEHAHLDRRHHLVVQVAEVVVRVLAPVRMLPSYSAQVRRLIELDADDQACRSVRRTDLARALLTMSTPALPPSGGLAIAPTSTAARIDRLIAPPPPHRVRSSSVVVLAFASVVAPIVGMAAPAVWAMLAI